MKRSLWAVLLVLIGLGCDSRQDQLASDPRGAAAPRYDTQRGSGQSDFRERQAAFLNRIRQSDPRYATIQRAVLNENNELGLILSRNVEMDSIPTLMRGMLAKMAKEFPGTGFRSPFPGFYSR